VRRLLLLSALFLAGCQTDAEVASIKSMPDELAFQKADEGLQRNLKDPYSAKIDRWERGGIILKSAA
jgi:hypothetical protein